MAKILPSPSSDMGTNADMATWCHTAAILKVTQEKEDKFYPAPQIPSAASSALGLKVYVSFCLPLITMTDPPKWRTLNPQSPTLECGLGRKRCYCSAQKAASSLPSSTVQVSKAVPLPTGDSLRNGDTCGDPLPPQHCEPSYCCSGDVPICTA